MNSRKFIFILGVAIILFGVWISGVWEIPQIKNINKKNECLMNKLMAPEITLFNLNGNKVKLTDFRGKVVILDFWATWCAPCRKELAHLNELYKRYKNNGLVVIGISLDRTKPEEIKVFLENLGVEFPNLMGDEKILEVFSSLPGFGPIKGIPTTFIIDREGKICRRFVGFTEENIFEEVIKTLL